MSDLFGNMPESLSPKEAWKRKHNINTLEPRDDGETCDLTGVEGDEWVAYQGEPGPNNATNTTALSESMALEKLAVKLKLEIPAFMRPQFD